MIYRCVIIDDEPHAIEGLKSYIIKIPELEIIATYTDPIYALQEIAKGDKIDLLLLDIDMPEISGIELARLIREKTNKLLITTAHTHYGYEAFEIQADGYLLKPFSFAKFLTAIHKLFPPPVQESDTARLSDEHSFFFIKSKDDHLKLVKIRYDDMIMVEDKLDYVIVYTVYRSILTDISLTEISNRASKEKGFEQFHKNFILNSKHIEYIDRNTITLNNGRRITVGEHYQKDFNAFITRNL